MYTKIKCTIEYKITLEIEHTKNIAMDLIRSVKNPLLEDNSTYQRSKVCKYILNK